jgi:hypothetical protein
LTKELVEGPSTEVKIVGSQVLRGDLPDGGLFVTR